MSDEARYLLYVFLSLPIIILVGFTVFMGWNLHYLKSRKRFLRRQDEALAAKDWAAKEKEWQQEAEKD